MKKIEIKSYTDSSSLLYAIGFLILGALLFTNPGGIVRFISYIIGGFFIVIGGYKLLHYYSMKKKELVTNNMDFAIGLIGIILGITFMLCSSAIETALRYIMGAWILFSGINRLVSTFKYKGQNRFISLLVVSLLLIICGLYIILRTNLVFSMIGLVIMTYSIIEIAGYILYRKDDN